MHSVLFSLFITFGMTASAQSFRSGVQFQATDSYGNLTLTCSDPSIGQQTVRCQQRTLAPLEYDYFIGPTGVLADSVVLSTDLTGPKAVSKSSPYSNGMSTQTFNLWINTLFSKPLLVSGDNLLHYSLSYAGKIVQAGTFHTYVIPGAPKLCTAITQGQSSDSECANPFSDCQQYFQQATCN